MIFNEYDIFLAKVPFEDIPQEKIRPVLILKDRVYLVECLKMTSAKTRILNSQFSVFNYPNPYLKIDSLTNPRFIRYFISY